MHSEKFSIVRITEDVLCLQNNYYWEQRAGDHEAADSFLPLSPPGRGLLGVIIVYKAAVGTLPSAEGSADSSVCHYLPMRRSGVRF